ncbi:MAG: OmpA family protein [Elusimicrobia bacterium]|nr:OmpA family protein [Elusimicrobiota bacterium]
MIRKKAASGPTRYGVAFSQGSYQLDPKYESLVGKIAAAAAAHPAGHLAITGYAASSEANAAQLARQRGQIIANLLINRYGMDPSRLKVSSSVSEAAPDRASVEFSQ